MTSSRIDLRGKVAIVTGGNGGIGLGMARGLADAGADIVGSNCGNGSAVMVEIAREIRASTTLPVAIQPNAGLPEVRGVQVIYPEAPAAMAESARALLDAGVAIVGGCCGTTPEHVRALRAVVDAAR